MTILLPLPRRLRFWTNREAKRIVWTIFLFLFAIAFIDNFGLVKIYFEKDFQTQFSYPLDIPDFRDFIHRFKKGEQQRFEYEPINKNYSSVAFMEDSIAQCKGEDTIGLLILVKSAPHYLEKRKTIRETWGDPEYLLNISKAIPDSSPLFACCKTKTEKKRQAFHVKLVFLLGETPGVHDGYGNHGPESMEGRFPSTKSLRVDEERSAKDKQRLTSSDSSTNDLQLVDAINQEILMHQDIVIADFLDSYENNTFKTMIGLRYALEKCSNFQFAFLVDDDMFINMKNVIRFLESPKTYPGEMAPAKGPEDILHSECNGGDNNCDIYDKLFAGKILLTRPVRSKLGSKWYLSLEEYSYNYFPPYIPAAAIIMSKSVVEDFYFASYYTQHFRFDDVYLGLLAFKMNITPFNSNYFYVCHSTTGQCPDDERLSHLSNSLINEDIDSMKHIIALHGLKGPQELRGLWSEQKAKGNLM